MTQPLIDWKKLGSIIEFGPSKLQIFAIDQGNSSTPPSDTVLLIHGFPESSYSFHRVIKRLSTRFKRIILLDMIGYGWSDKPVDTFAYSMHEQSEVVLTVWKALGVTGGHIICHDMGVSVTTELLTKWQNQQIGEWFHQGIKSITFTNGSMVLSMSQLRVMQKILVSKYGYLLRKLPTYRIFKQQVLSAHGNNNLTEEAINNLWHSNLIQEGHQKTYLTIRYLIDRKRFETTRWLPALSKATIPIHLCWGEDDNVARVGMAHFLKENICPQAKLTIMKNVGHFGQLGNPAVWSESVLAFYN